MSVPHLDLRAANGRHYLLFGPSRHFCRYWKKNRGFFEYLCSMRLHDIPGLLSVAREHFPLMKYLIGETIQGRAAMLKELSLSPGFVDKI